MQFDNVMYESEESPQGGGHIEWRHKWRGQLAYQAGMGWKTRVQGTTYRLPEPLTLLRVVGKGLGWGP